MIFEKSSNILNEYGYKSESGLLLAQIREDYKKFKIVKRIAKAKVKAERKLYHITGKDFVIFVITGSIIIWKLNELLMLKGL